MSIRPVSRCLPTSQALWDDTNLPMCVVLTPCEESEEDEEKISGSNDVNKNNLSDATSSSMASFAKPLAAIPKCLQCGAPHPTSTTHFRPQYSSQLLCYLCGKTSSTLFTDQQDARLDEVLNVDTYDKLSVHQLRRNTSSLSMVDTHDFRVPLEINALKDKSSSSPSSPSVTWQLPAMACPPVWWIVVDGTVSSSHNNRSSKAVRQYWDTVQAVLEHALEDIPPHVHVGMVTATASNLSCWDFMTRTTSERDDFVTAVPQVQHIPYAYTPDGSNNGNANNDNGNDHGSKGAWDLCLVPANAVYKGAIQAAVRAMAHAACSTRVFQDNQLEEEEKKADDNSVIDNIMEKENLGFPLGLTLEILLEFMEQARHPGQDASEESTGNEEDDVPLRYAGGKILCLLGNPLMEIVPISQESMAYRLQPPFHQGGVAGACFVDDDSDRWGTDANQPEDANDFTDKETNDLTDMTSSNLANFMMPLEPEDMFATIGKRCAMAALGVDLIVLAPEPENAESENVTIDTIPWYGLPALRVLSDASGAPGPLMFGTAPSSLVTLQENIMCRTPWQPGMVFGSQMRLRVSPGFEIEDSPVEKEGKVPLQLAPFLSSAGLMGPACAAGESSDADPGLWIMGTCDPYTSFTVDLQAAKSVKDRFHVDGFGEVALRPVFQTCMMYTCVETDGSEDNPNFYTVCKMRISSLAVPLVEDAEPIYDALDPEALATVLFHKISLDAYLAGLSSAQDTAESWLRSLMSCVYQSAQVEQAKLEEEIQSSQRIQRASPTASNFVGSERLIDQEGDLDVEDVLLGQGHSKVGVVPLLIFALMQCDALRPSGGNFLPSMDARVCALTQMASMTPSVLAKAIAPSLVLWSMKDDEAIIETLPLSRDGILNSMEGMCEENEGILLLDSPRQVILYRAERMQQTSKKTKKSGKIALDVGPNLETTILSCLKGFRTVPTGWRELESFLEGNEFKEVPSRTFMSALLEDKPTASGIPNHAEWKLEMALLIQEDLEKSGDI